MRNGCSSCSARSIPPGATLQIHITPHQRQAMQLDDDTLAQAVAAVRRDANAKFVDDEPEYLSGPHLQF